MKRTIFAATMAALALPAAPVLAHGNGWHSDHNRQASYRPARSYYTDNGIQYWNGNDGRRYCRKPDGTVGLLIGGAAGALLGRAIDTRGERATGTILGAAAGALLGNEVARGRSRCR